MGQVFEAKDERLERRVAVKIVELSSSAVPQVGERFRREAIATARLNHPNVVTIFDSGTEGSLAYLVMELLPGKPLAQMVRESGPLPIPAAIRIGEQVAKALQATHGIGVVHRDVKPANIMIHGDAVTLLDFGIAQVTLDAEATVTVASSTVGTAAYMSPEQAQGQRATPASDVYALGAVLMVMLTGQPPFPGEHAIAVLNRQINEAAPSVRSRRSEVPATLDDLVGRMLAKNPSVRPDPTQTAASLGQLARNLSHPAATAVLAAVPGPPAVAPPPSPAPPPPPSLPPDLGRANAAGFRRAASWIALIIVGLLVFAVVYALGSNFIGQLLPGTRASSGAPSETGADPPAPEPTTDATDPASSIEPPPIDLPQMPQVDIPGAEAVGLEAALRIVGAAIEGIDETRSDQAAQAEIVLTEEWEQTSLAIREGGDVTEALDSFGGLLNNELNKGAINVLEASGIKAALSGVAAAG